MSYFKPPSNYYPPTRCTKCQGAIRLTVIRQGGKLDRAWLHLGTSDHAVVMRKAGWWDTRRGVIVKEHST
jgi:hypothetical protein